MQRTYDELVAQARTLTAERGLAGFTVEELCDRVGISRRTFFNYFPTKEDAVFGEYDTGFPQKEQDEFVARGAGDHAGLSPTLLSDIARLVITRARHNDFTRQRHQLFRDIVRAEPHLMAKLMAVGESQQRDFARLVAAREGLPPDDPLPNAIVGVTLSLTFQTVDEFFSDDNDHSFEELLERNIAIARQFFGQPLRLPDPTARPDPTGSP
ncbi:TetR family transcriptional regulator [Rhodococcus sp. NPDC060090]|uniref:TetR family transcriptional regulator n=1 Tax=Rhodococcus sp. NPDC060090 TaxID=3347056 RepID=UPI00365A6124